jgi:hypothetical protein
VNMRSARPESIVTLGFKLPVNGSYYVGSPVMVYYTPAGEIRLYRDDIGGSIELEETSRNLWRNPRIDYLADWPGGLRTVKTASIRDFSAYILPDMTYLPVERVVLEELEAR